MQSRNPALLNRISVQLLMSTWLNVSVILTLSDPISQRPPLALPAPGDEESDVDDFTDEEEDMEDEDEEEQPRRVRNIFKKR